MGRNDECFCGSGKKVKKCHAEFNENSRAANVLSLYNNIKRAIDRHYEVTGYKYPCREGCSECCYDYFPISDIEFDLITLEMGNWNSEEIDDISKKTKIYWDKMMSINPEYTDNLEQMLIGRNSEQAIFKDIQFTFGGKEFPCLFLDERGKCKVCNSRPFMCRMYGVSYHEYEVTEENQIKAELYMRVLNYDENHNVCSKIGSNLEAKEWQADISKYNKDILSLRVLKSPKYDFAVNRRTYPIIYWLYMAFYKYKSGLGIPNYEAKFEVSENRYIDVMYEQLIKKAGK